MEGIPRYYWGGERSGEVEKEERREKSEERWRVAQKGSEGETAVQASQAEQVTLRVKTEWVENRGRGGKDKDVHVGVLELVLEALSAGVGVELHSGNTRVVLPEDGLSLSTKEGEGEGKGGAKKGQFRIFMNDERFIRRT
jgi:hypothetical protein